MGSRKVERKRKSSAPTLALFGNSLAWQASQSTWGFVHAALLLAIIVIVFRGYHLLYTIVTMGFLLLLFLVFFAPLLLFIGKYRASEYPWLAY